MSVATNGIELVKSRKCESEDKGEVDEEKCWLQVTASAIGSLSSISDGLLTAWTSPFIVKISSDKENYDISEAEASYFPVLPYVATVATSLLFAVLADRIGRKRTLMLSAIPHVTSWMLTAVAEDVYMFYVARFISGMGTACIFATISTYTGEISSPKVRGLNGSFPSSINFFGQFLMNVLGNYFSVKVTAYICMPIPVLFLFLFSLMPESPTFYLMKQDDESARNALRRLTRKSDVETELLMLKEDVARQISERGTWNDLVTITSNRRALTAGVILRVSQQLSGMAIFSTSTQFIFEKSSGSVSSKAATLITSFSSFTSYQVAGFLMQKMNRRGTYMISLLISGTLLTLESLYFYLDEYHPEIDTQSFNWFPLAGMMACIICGSLGPGVIPTIMVGELYSASIKAKACTLNAVVFGVMMFAANNIFYQVYAVTGLCGPFLIFGSSSLLFVILCYFYLPETRGQSLEEIQQKLKQKRYI